MTAEAAICFLYDNDNSATHSGQNFRRELSIKSRNLLLLLLLTP